MLGLRSIYRVCLQLEVKIQELNATVLALDKEIADMYVKMKKAKGRQQAFYKNRCVMLMKKRKMYQQQIDNLVGQQFSVDQMAITQDAIKNTIETVMTYHRNIFSNCLIRLQR